MNAKTAVKVGVAAGAMALVASLGGCASLDRQWKTAQSNTTGLNRKVTDIDQASAFRRGDVVQLLM